MYAMRAKRGRVGLRSATLGASLLLALVVATPASAAGDGPVCLSPADLARLKRELAAEIRAEVLQQLKAESGTASPAAGSAPDTAVPQALADGAPAPAPSGGAQEATLHYQPGAGLSIGQHLRLQGFADVTYLASSHRPSGEPSSSFVLGDFDLYMTARLTDRFSFLAETVFEAEPHSTAVEVERLQGTYVFSDAVRATLGRIHTPLGYWNTAYHHGKWLQPTIERPFAVAFEDDGGILPSHSVGVSLDGRLPGSRVDFTYDVGVANGRAARADEVANLDDNSEKAVYGRLGAALGSIPLRFGVSGFYDQIPRDTERGRGHEIGEAVAGAHAVFDDTRLLVLAEYFHVHHDQPRGPDADTDAWYAYAGYRRDRWTPYAMAEGLAIDADDPYYERTGHRRRYTFGLRIDVLPMANVKIEYRRLDETGIPDSNQLGLQAAVAF